ncbi:hypothetical protein [Enterovirga aerilata]|uniref:Uncharacterized protein n=1 Tax=Enterovirga aerilata TaxID=2730920 RepID=A0A849IBN7_9HYPH|nr:hypothetical protein [Enterovirga sp. DB1703]NNM74818.1 hypothetical protein [Enterovirga sp. DB1703]
MKTIILAIVAAVLLAGAAAYLLSVNQKPAYQAFSTTGARVTPTDNLVGPNWSGDPQGRGAGHRG